MKTIQISIDVPLLTRVDRTIEALNMTRSTFIQEALKIAPQHYQILEMEKKHAQGYARQPVEPGEFDLWGDEQVW